MDKQYSICRTKTRSKTKLGDWHFAVTEEKSVIASGGNGSCSPQVALHNQRGSRDRKLSVQPIKITSGTLRTSFRASKLKET